MARYEQAVRKESRHAAYAVCGVLAVLASVKLGTGVLGQPGALVGVVATISVLLVTRAGKATLHDLGVSRHTLRVGATWAIALVALIAAGYGVAAAGASVLPAVAAWVDGLTSAPSGDDADRALRQALIAIPLGTVLIEEVAFRGAIPALFIRAGASTRAAISGAALIFGLWHVIPSLQVAAAAPEGSMPVWAVVGVTLLFTTAAGLLLGWLRHRTGSLLPPVAVHLATNSLGVALVWYLSLGS